MSDIIALLDPKIELKELSVANTEDKEINADSVTTKVSKSAGSLSPTIGINDMIFNEQAIDSFKLSVEGFLPVVNFTIKDYSGLFTSKTYPKDGDLVMVYMRSLNKDFKPIRQDFRIYDVQSVELVNDTNFQRKAHTITAILEVPEIYNELCKSYKGTSFETLNKIAEELKLGYASNVKSTVDEMTRIMTFDSHRSFIKEITESSYKDESSFFTAFIDQYYFLNFIELNSRFVLDKEVETSTVHDIMTGDMYKNDGPNDIPTKKFPLLLTNHPNAITTPQYITKLNPFNDTGTVWLDHGYRNNLMLYDKDKKEKQQYYLETLNTEGSQDKKLLKGREDEDHLSFQKYTYLGQQQNSNVHKNYVHAVINNRLNIDEIGKMGLMVELPNINPNIYRYQIIPVILFKYDSDYLKQTDNKYLSDNNLGIYDKEMSGYYVISDIYYIYNKSTFSMKIKLLRREWEFESSTN